ncbi:REP-associated tyrosine transposase [Stutzerimonas marianensis]|uniref:REP-associated tyrosine transposase n=1 Tax=Stutzerimonas marianensis TaxID=2929513 RepID=UPI003C2FB8E1
MPSHFTHRGHALRRGRHSETGHVYLITAVTERRARLFTDPMLARLLVSEMRRLDDERYVESLAWVVMPDHVHWLIELNSMPLPAVIQRLKSRSAIAINRITGETGTRIWQRGFHDRALRQEEDVIATARYVVANPLRAGLVDRIGDYPWWDAVWL